MPAWQEWLAGTVPTNGECVLVFDWIAPTGTASQAVIVWRSVSNRLYDLDRATNLVADGFAPYDTGIQATPPENTYTDNVDGLSEVFYRVRTGP
jgi:hypothetical protein